MKFLLNKRCSLFLSMVILSIFFITSVQGALTDNLLASWTFDTDATDDHTNSKDFTEENSPTHTTTGCKNSGCYDLTGATDRLCRADDNDFDFDRTDSFTISMWFKTSTSHTGALINKQLGGSPWNGYLVQTTTTTKMFTHQKDTGGTAIERGRDGWTYTDGNWHHIVTRYNGTSSNTGITFYVDGTKYTSYDTANTLTNTMANNAYLCMGERRGDGFGKLNGYVDEVSFWTRELTDSEVSDLYNGGTGLFYGGYADVGTLTINTALVNNTNSTDNPFAWTVNGTVADTNDVFNISFYVDGSLQQTVVNQAFNNTNIVFNFSDGNGAYTFNITALNNESVVSSIERDVFIDTVQPVITIVSGLTNNTLIEKTDQINLVVNYSDTNLEAINYTVYRLNSDRSIDTQMNNTFVQNIVSDRYTLNFSDDFSNTNWINGREYSVVLSAWDGHTTKKLLSSPTKVLNTIHYRGLKFYCDKTETISWDLTHDSVKPIIDFTTPARRQTCYYETNGEWSKVKRIDQELSMWYVDIGNRFWIDAKHENVEVDLIEPNILKIVYIFDNPVQSLQTESFGDLNFNTLTYFFTLDSYTTYYGNQVNITDITLSGNDWQLVSNQTFNLTETTGLFFKYTTNSQRSLTNAQSNDLYINLTIDGNQLISKKIRSMTGESIGVSGFFENYTASAGSHNLEFYMREVGNGDVDIFNTDFGIISSKIQNNESVCSPLIQRDTVTFNNQDFQPVINFSMNDYDSRNIIQFQGIVNASGTTEIDLYIQHVDDGDNSTFIERYISSDTDTGSIFDTYFDEHYLTNKNFSIYARSHNTEFITLDSTLFGGCMDTINGTKIQTLSTTNESSDEVNNITLTAGTHRLFTLPVTMKNGTSFFIESTISFKSSSGEQIPLINVSSLNGLCNSVKQRTLSDNNDIGNAFITCVANGLSAGASETFFLDVTVASGETLEIIDETLNLWEVVNLDLTTINIAPIISFSSDLPTITAGIDTSVTITGQDFNADNINLNITWYVNGVEKTTDNATISSGGSNTFTLSSGNYIAGQFVNATVTSDDGTDAGNIIYSATQEVIAPTSTTDELLESINNTLTNLESTQNETQGDFTMLWIIIAVIFFLIAGVYTRLWFLWSISGVFVFTAGLKMGQIFIDNGQSYYQATTYIFFVIGILLILTGMFLQLFVKSFLPKEDIYKNIRY